jgi:[ribosomal protein S5]-alanine N-acetyltransferase
MAEFPPVLMTERLSLDRAHVEDAADVFEYAKDPEVSKYMTFPTANTVEDVIPYLTSIQESMDFDREFHWGIRLDNSPKLMGMVTLRRLHGLEISYVLNREFWGNGYMPEAVIGLIQWAMRHEPLQRIWATVDIENEKSAKTLQKVGMTEEGVLRRWALHPNISDTPRDCRVFSLP